MTTCPSEQAGRTPGSAQNLAIETKTAAGGFNVAPPPWALRRGRALPKRPWPTGASRIRPGSLTARDVRDTWTGRPHPSCRSGGT